MFLRYLAKPQAFPQSPDTKDHAPDAVRVFGLICCVMLSTSANAQVTFAWPDVEPDVVRYNSVEECLAAVRNMPVMLQSPPQDTMPWREARVKNVLPDTVVHLAQRCAAKFSVDTLMARDTPAIQSMLSAHALLLFAHRDEDAMVLTRRWVTSVPPERDTLRLGIRIFAINQLLSVLPRRFGDAWQLIDEIAMTPFWRPRINVVAQVMETARDIGDTVNALRAARWLIDVPSLVSDSVLGSDVWQNRRTGVGLVILAAGEYLSKQALLDSLRTSAGAYQRHLQILRDKARLSWTEDPTSAVPVQGKYWFPRPPDVARPTVGTVSVVLTTQDTDCRSCVPGVAMVRRLHTEFPEVEFTLVSRTRGYYGLVMEPPPPETEARLIDSVYRKVHHLPATVVVEKTPFWRIPDPDRRRINEAGPNEATYPAPEVGGGIAYLIDQSGNILYKGAWELGQSEEQLRDLIRALVQRAP